MNPPVTRSPKSKLLLVVLLIGVMLAGGLWWYTSSDTGDEKEGPNPGHSEENDSSDSDTDNARSPAKAPEKNASSIAMGKAISVPKPVYPQEARAAGVKGSVNVRVTIDTEGNVISAKAVSGHPLVHKAAETAALKAKFHPTTLSGKPVQVSGTLVYNFK